MAEAEEIPLPMLFELCSGGTAYEGKPQVKTHVKLDTVMEAVQARPGYSILAYTPYMLIVKTPSGAEVSLTRRGKLLIKRVENEQSARNAAYDVLRLGAAGVTIDEQHQSRAKPGAS